MSALSELIPYGIYIFLALFCLGFLILTFTSPKPTRPWTFIGSACFAFLFFKFKSCEKEQYRQNQLDHVGIYWLTEYPNCNSCYLELKEDMTYVIVNKAKIVETSNWHYEMGGDYFITFLNNDRDQLGSGAYAYRDYKLKYQRAPY